MDTKKYPDNKTGYIRFAYDELSDDDKITVDLLVKSVLDFYKRKNAETTGAVHQMSRDGALDIIYNLTRFVNSKAVIE